MSNRLQTETSPYLLQHAANPVHWQPWDEQALQQARDLDKPILLSIGYSACHWCHVMAHESFADEATAAVMNDGFINIKVDREERPDLDKVYQLAHQVLTQQTGGWPLTMFLDPHSLLPFFGGTYFPKTPRQQMPGFTDLLARVSEAWRDQREELSEQGEKLTEVFANINVSDVAQSLSDDQELAEAARTALAGQYDSAEGGFGSAPKFPMASTLSFLLRYAVVQQDRDAMDMVMTTLTRIARGGIYDHLGGGFFRYATDRMWAIPHFEKMLYDNGQLLSLYADAVAVGPDALFTDALRDTAGWLLREMTDAGGGFYAARDADSEGEEGKYYVWRRDEIKRALSEDEYLLIETLYGIDKPANFASRWNLTRRDAWRSVVHRLSLSPEVAQDTLNSARNKLLKLRETRQAPGLDNKVLTAWNAMAIKGLAKTSAALGEPAWLEAAQRCADFLRKELFDGETLYATWQGQARFPAYLDDYANLLDALTILLSIRWREGDAAFAKTLADMALARFVDPESGGFYFTDSGDELFHRPKPTMDDATPPGNGVMADALIRLGHLFAEPRYLEAAEATLCWADTRMRQYPAGHCTLLSALADCNRPPEQIIVRGPEDQLGEWLAICREGYRPQRLSYGIPYDGNRTVPTFLPKLVSIEEQNSVVAFHCENFACSPPIRSLDALKAALRSG